MIPPLKMNDTELLNQIENCTLNPTFFTHEVLLRMTYILIEKYGLETAIIKNCELKENYYKNVLNNNKFNHTLTRAYTEILDYFMKSSNNSSFEKLLKNFPRLQYNFKDLVKTHYGYNILKEHRQEAAEYRGPILFTF